MRDIIFVMRAVEVRKNTTLDIFENQNTPVALPNNATNTKEAIMYFDYEKALERQYDTPIKSVTVSDIIKNTDLENKDEIIEFIKKYDWNNYISGIAMKRLKQFHIIEVLSDAFPDLT